MVPILSQRYTPVSPQAGYLPSFYPDVVGAAEGSDSIAASVGHANLLHVATGGAVGAAPSSPRG